MSVAYISIGSNLGDRKANIDASVEKLKSRKNIEVKAISSIIETDPVGDNEQPKFLNACLKIDTILYPDELLETLKSIEREMGRSKDSSAVKLTQEEKLKLLKEGRVDEIEARLEAERLASQRNDRKERKWGPRVIDLDILFYDDIIMKGNNLVIPHPLLHERIFVLRPLSEIAPDLMHPVLQKTIKDLLFEFRVEYESS